MGLQRSGSIGGTRVLGVTARRYGLGITFVLVCKLGREAGGNGSVGSSCVRKNYLVERGSIRRFPGKLCVRIHRS
jgi:hypothetical protein